MRERNIRLVSILKVVQELVIAVRTTGIPIARKQRFRVVSPYSEQYGGIVY